MLHAVLLSAAGEAAREVETGSPSCHHHSSRMLLVPNSPGVGTMVDELAPSRRLAQLAIARLRVRDQVLDDDVIPLAAGVLALLGGGVIRYVYWNGARSVIAEFTTTTRLNGDASASAALPAAAAAAEVERTRRQLAAAAGGAGG